MFRSIRHSLLFWYAVALILVVAGYGIVLYQRLSLSLRKEIDARLQVRSHVVAATLRQEPDGQLALEPTEELLREFRVRGKKEQGKPRPPAGEGDAPYYAVWDAQGRVLEQSGPGVELPQPEPCPPNHRDATKPRLRNRGLLRELGVRGPYGSVILVGQNTREAQGHLQDFLAATLAAGGGVAALALAGGWYVTRRALAPIARMGDTAAQISESSLSQRIDVSRMPRELARLAEVLNGAFDRLEAAFQRQAAFTADASHELRTPLCVMTTQAELALKQERSAAEYRDAIAKCLGAAQRMRSVVDGLLILARSDRGDVCLATTRFDLQTVVEEVASLLGPLAAERGVSVRLEMSCAEIVADRAMIRQVVVNLLRNAVLYNRERGSVDATVHATADEVAFAVRDTGVGIPESDQPRVFERFFRVDEARSRATGGSGLGLAIAKSIVARHGGRIVLQSEPDVGTCVTVRLPRDAQLAAVGCLD